MAVLMHLKNSILSMRICDTYLFVASAWRSYALTSPPTEECFYRLSLLQVSTGQVNTCEEGGGWSCLLFYRVFC